MFLARQPTPSETISVHLLELRLVLTALTGVAILSGCGGNDPPIPSAVVVSPPSLSLTAIGQTGQLTATVEDENGAIMPETQVSWTSSNPSVASVSSAGVVTA